jgi:uncharacterized protein YecE (DUF72 family)
LNRPKCVVMKTLIGCSGYSYNDWKGNFYPGDLPQNQWLSFYASKFNTVEINNTFYKFPQKESLEKWLSQTPAHFRFSIKAHRFFTHLKKFNVDEAFIEKLNNFQAALKPLKEKAGCVLWQIPGNLHKNIPKLESFCQKLDQDYTHALELRHTSWFDEEVYAILKEYNIICCTISAPGNLPEDLIVTHKTIAYVRFHEKKEWYDYLYSEEELKHWKKRLDHLRNTDQLFIYFNNDKHGNAIKKSFMMPSKNQKNQHCISLFMHWASGMWENTWPGCWPGSTKHGMHFRMSLKSN